MQGITIKQASRSERIRGVTREKNKRKGRDQVKKVIVIKPQESRGLGVSTLPEILQTLKAL